MSDTTATSPLDVTGILLAFGADAKKGKSPALWSGNFARILGLIPAYDGVALYIMATLARLAYYEDTKYRQRMKEALFADSFGVLNISDPLIPRMPFVRIGNKVFMGIEGTNRWRQWLQFQATAKTVGLLNCPGLWWDVIANYAGRLFDQVKGAWPDSPALDFYISGHSLGGAIGQALAALIKANTAHFVRLLVTFGSPRVANKAANVDFFWNSTHRIRVTNEDDPVPAIPPPLGCQVSLTDGVSTASFRHMEDSAVFFNREGQISDSVFTGAPSMQAIGALGDLARLDVLPQHKIPVYVANCNRSAWREGYRYTGTQDALDDLNGVMDQDDGETLFLPLNNPDLPALQAKARAQTGPLPSSIRTFLLSLKTVG